METSLAEKKLLREIRLGRSLDSVLSAHQVRVCHGLRTSGRRAKISSQEGENARLSAKRTKTERLDSFGLSVLYV